MKLIPSLLLATLCAHANNFKLYNIVPNYDGHEVEQAAKCVEMYERTGVPLAMYSLTLHPEGKPAKAKVDKYVASYKRFAKALEGTKVTPGILVQAILGHWPRADKDIEPWERTIDQSGKVVRFCPLDPGFGEYIEYVFKELAATKPAFILTDDDVRAYSHGAECFCATHTKLFNERCGTNYDSNGLRAAVAASKPGEKIYDTFLALQREMMEEAVVGRIRKAIDSVNPSIPAGICVASEEHYMAAPLARRIAAKGQRPVVRVSTGCYNERMSASRFPDVFLRMQGFTEYLRDEGFDVLDEADTCPQNAWSKSARSFFTHMMAAAFSGMCGAKTWYVNTIRANGVPVTQAYTDVISEQRGVLDAIVKAVEGTEPIGVAVPCFTNHPNWHLVKNHDEFMTQGGGMFAAVFAPFGIPTYASRGFGEKNRVFVLSSAAEVNRLSDTELEKMLSGNVLVARDAALAITSRGRSDLIGVKAAKKKLVITAERDNATGRLLSFTSYDDPIEFEPIPAAQRLSEFVFAPYAGAEPEVVAPSAVYYRNALGGQVISIAYHQRMFCLHQYSEARKDWLVALIDRLSGAQKFTICENTQDVMTTERIAADGTRLVLAVNLNADPVRNLKLRVPAGAKVERLTGDGSWAQEEKTQLGFYEAAVLRVKSAK